MSDKVYASASGFVQFDVKERDANNQTVRDVTIKSTGSQQLISVTVWPEFDGVEIKKGDFVAVDGLYKVNSGQSKDGGTKDYHNISAGSLVVIPGAVKAESEVVRATVTPASTPSF